MVRNTCLPGYETKVREALIERIERLGMDEFFGEIMVPSEEVVEMKGGQERKSKEIMLRSCKYGTLMMIVGIY